MWKINWIHPFADGNGRTSRALSYMILSIHEKCLLPGTPTIPDQIVQNKEPYYTALAKADEDLKKGKINVGRMEDLLEELLSVQLASIRRHASGHD